jgi:hypothetical protein
MTRHALLNNVSHKDLRVITRRSAQFGDDVMAALTFPAEFRNLQAHYPIVFSKSKEGVFSPLALFGFRDRQNLFLGPDGWDAPYVPMMVERQPFFIGKDSKDEEVIHIDLDSAHVSQTEGEVLFREHGGSSEFLDRIGALLATISQGNAATQPFIAALNEYNLLEAFSLDIRFADGAEHRFAGFYTIQEERLAKLDAEALGKLHARGYLQAIFMVIASLSHFRDLIARASKLDAAGR